MRKTAWGDLWKSRETVQREKGKDSYMKRTYRGRCPTRHTQISGVEGHGVKMYRGTTPAASVPGTLVLGD